MFLKVYLHVYGTYIHSTEHTEEVPKNLSIDKKNVYTPKLYPSFCKLIALKIVEVHSNHGNNNFRYFFTFFVHSFGVFPYKLETNITPIAMHIYFHSDFFFLFYQNKSKKKKKAINFHHFALTEWLAITVVEIKMFAFKVF